MTDNTVTVAERVATACHASNLRVHIDSNRGSQADVLMAMAWSQSRLGSALMRLQSEYDAIEKPRHLTHEAMVRLALTMESTELDPKERVKDIQTKAKAEAAKWYYTEKQLFLGKLKTLPGVKHQITLYCEKLNLQNPQKISTAVIGYWMDQICHACNGLKFDVIPDSPALSAAPCKACGGTGLSRAPYGRTGAVILNYLDDCVSRAQSSIRDKLKKHHGFTKT